MTYIDFWLTLGLAKAWRNGLRPSAPGTPVITYRGGGGLHNGRGGGQVSFFPKKKKGVRGGGRGEGKVLAMLKGWGTNIFEVVITWELDVLATLKGGRKSFHPLRKKRRRGQKTF